MRKYLIATVLIAGFAAPALAVETTYIMFDNTMKGCVLMTHNPGTARYTMLGHAGSRAKAQRMMHAMKQCG